MSQSYTRDQIKSGVAKILQILGWNSINSTPLELLTDILDTYIEQITRGVNNYANEFGCTQPNLDHLGLTFRDMSISVAELEEYVQYVNFGPPPNAVTKYPISKEDHLNFLKPGSKEVVTRPVHIHEHLPPMNPLLEGTENDAENVICKTDETDENNPENGQIFKKPADILPMEFKRPGFPREEESSRPTREMSSVMMTSSGFISPSREGKLPESRTPISSIDTISPLNANVETVDLNKKPTKTVKRVEKRKVKNGTSFAADPLVSEEKKKKLGKMNWPKISPGILNYLGMGTDVKISPVPNKVHPAAKLNKALAAARLKTEKLNTTITPITIKPMSPQVVANDIDNVDKLFSEPDKKKVNIFKKISNVKNEKIDSKISKKDDLRQESRESSPDLIIDEPDDIVSKLPHLPSDVTIEPIHSTFPFKNPDKNETSFIPNSTPPGTPTPKTPEMLSHSPPVIKEKRRRKDSRRLKKIQKHQSPHRIDNGPVAMDLERPKTPEAQVVPKLEVPLNPMLEMPPTAPIPFPFLTNFGGPGLIPAPLAGPLFPPLPFPSMNIPHFGQKPHLSPFHPPVAVPNSTPSPNLIQTPKIEEPPNKTSVEKLPPTIPEPLTSPSSKPDKKSKEHKKEKKDKIKKRNKKDKVKNKAEKKKLKEEKKEKVKKEKKDKRKDKELKEVDSPLNVKITLKIKSPSPRPETPETRKLNIKPIVKKEDEPPGNNSNTEERHRETSPGLAKISALVKGPPKPKPINPPVAQQPAEDTIQDEHPITPAPRPGPGPGRPRIHPLKPKPSKPKKRRTPVKKDADGNEVWICPACGRQDDGSPMIGCDGCDAWYHWVCVGIQVPPDDNEDWYCRHCLLRKNEDLQSDKQKKKRKKREKKEH